LSFKDPYVDPKSGVLKNRFGATTQEKLDRIEREFVVQRILEGCPTGAFDLRHLQAIHRHLFQDIFDWAGEIRTVEMIKNGDQFQFLSYIETGMQDVHSRLSAQRFLKGLSPSKFANAAAHVVGDVNYVHPFREGNGRTQLQYLQQLASEAGHMLDVSTFQGKWIEASRASHRGDYNPMAAEILASIEAAG
jgi:cell filamentation protein